MAKKIKTQTATVTTQVETTQTETTPEVFKAPVVRQNPGSAFDWHPLAWAFPMGDVSGPEWEAFCNSVAENQQESIVLYEFTGPDGKPVKQLLDGRRRELACLTRGVEPRYVPFTGTVEEARRLAVDANLHRRHLSESQRAMVAVGLAAAMAEVAAMAKAKKAKAKKTKAQPDAGTNLSSLSANGEVLASPGVAPEVPDFDGPVDDRSPVEAAAQAVNVSPMSVKLAKRVKDKGIAELQELVEDDKVAVSAAAELAKLPEDEQLDVVRKGPKAVAQRAAEMRQKAKAENKPAPLPCDPELLDALRNTDCVMSAVVNEETAEVVVELMNGQTYRLTRLK